MKRYYDKEGKRLIYIDQNSSPDFWDRWWKNSPSAEETGHNISALELANLFKQHLGSGSKILEAGCGNGGFVYAFQKAGLEAVGIDFAEITVQHLNVNYPELNIQLGDVRDLPFRDESFDGYYSGGVIEHFWNGYGEILSEAFRVLRPGGVAVFSFPAMNRLRQLKSLLKKYKYFINSSTCQPKDFYQFALLPETVVIDLKSAGFLIVGRTWKAGSKGLYDEALLARNIIKTYPSLKAKIVGKLGQIGARIWGHSIYIVVRKPSNV